MGAPASGGGAQRKRKKREERKAQAERDKQKRMAKTGRGDAGAASPANQRKKQQRREPASLLSEELAAELMQDGTGMSAAEFIIDPKAPKPKPKPQPSEVEVKMSNSQAKKLERLAKRKELEAKRVVHLESLAKNALDERDLGLLHSSGRLGQSNSKKQSLKLELQRQRAGLAPDESVRLTQEVGTGGGGSAPPIEEFEAPQAFGNRYSNPENAKLSARPAGTVELITDSTMMPDGRSVAMLPNVTALPSTQAKPFGDILPPAPKPVVRTQAKPFGDVLPPAPAPAPAAAAVVPASESAALPPRPMLVRQLSGVDGVRSLPRSPKAPAAAVAVGTTAVAAVAPKVVDDPSGNAAKRARRHPGNTPDTAPVKAAKAAGTWVPGLLPHQQPAAAAAAAADSQAALPPRPMLVRQVSGVDGVRTLHSPKSAAAATSAAAESQPQPQARPTSSSLIPTLTGDKEADEEALAEADTHVKVENERAAIRAAEAAASAAAAAEQGGKEEPVQKATEDQQATWIEVKRRRKVQKARMELPVCAEEQRVMEAIAEHDVVIVVGETGSGKTTQIPQFLFEAGYGQRRRDLPAGAGPGQAGHMMVGCTQPRRVAAYSMAKRVAYELNVPFGDVVGYQVRHESNVTRRTSVKFMTDGVLLRELEHDLLLPRYSAILLDEAHERTLNTDLLLGLLPRVVKLRADPKLSRGLPPLKLVIMSATVAAEEMVSNTSLFPAGPPPILRINARQHPVTVHFSKKTELGDYVTMATEHVSKIHKKLPHGGILVFLTGAHEVELTCKKLRQMYPRKRKEKKKAGQKGDKRPGDWECNVCGVNNFADRIVCFKCGDAKPAEIEDLDETDPKKTAELTSFSYGSEGGGDSGDEEQPSDNDEEDADSDASDQSDSDSDTADDSDAEEDEKRATGDAAEDGVISSTVSSPKRQRKRARSSSDLNAVAMQCQGHPRRGATSGRVSVVEMDTDTSSTPSSASSKTSASASSTEVSTNHPGAFWGMSLEEVKEQDASDIFDIMSSSSEEDDIDSDEENDDGRGNDGSDAEGGDEGDEDMRTARQRRREKRKKQLAERAAKAQEKLEQDAEKEEDGAEDEDEEDERAKAPLHVLPLYSMLPSEQQQRVFKPPPPGCRLVVVATNVAETSITIPGIRYVVDAGRAKQKVFADGSDSVYGYKVHWISKAGAKQRAGRAGRTGPGHCYKLYSSAVFDHHFPDWSTPEMSVMPLDAICLRLKCLGLSDVATFPFPTPPPPESLSRAVSVLRVLGLLDDQGLPTATGREVSAVPASPRLGLMLVLARRWGCAMHGAAVVAALSVGDPCMYGKQQIAPTAKEEDDKTTDGAAKPDGDGSEAGAEDEDEDEDEQAPQQPMLPAQVAFGDAHSDVLRVVNAVGAFEYERAVAIKEARADMMMQAAATASEEDGQGDGQEAQAADGAKSATAAKALVAAQVVAEEAAAGAVGKAFCDRYNINHKLLKEIMSLKAQLVRDTVPGGGRPKQQRNKKGEPEDITQQLLPPPDAQEKLKLRKLIVAGFIDRVARLKPIGDMPHHPTRGAAYIPCRQADGTEVEGDTGVAAGGARLVWLHRGSALHSTRTDDPPEWIVYQEAMEGRSRGGDGRAEKRYLKQITALTPEWLAELACADGGVVTTPLCRLSAPLPEPAPYYSAEVDAVLCYVRPSFGFGGTAWPLPLHPCALSATTGAREAGSASEYAVFGRALLEGGVLEGLAPLQQFWVGSPALMVRPNAETDGKVRELVSALRRANVVRRSTLLGKLEEDPKFLLPALQR